MWLHCLSSWYAEFIFETIERCESAQSLQRTCTKIGSIPCDIQKTLRNCGYIRKTQQLTLHWVKLNSRLKGRVSFPDFVDLKIPGVTSGIFQVIFRSEFLPVFKDMN